MRRFGYSRAPLGAGLGPGRTTLGLSRIDPRCRTTRPEHAVRWPTDRLWASYGTFGPCRPTPNPADSPATRSRPAYGRLGALRGQADDLAGLASGELDRLADYSDNLVKVNKSLRPITRTLSGDGNDRQELKDSTPRLRVVLDGDERRLLAPRLVR